MESEEHRSIKEEKMKQEELFEKAKREPLYIELSKEQLKTVYFRELHERDIPWLQITHDTCFPIRYNFDFYEGFFNGKFIYAALGGDTCPCPILSLISAEIVYQKEIEGIQIDDPEKPTIYIPTFLTIPSARRYGFGSKVFAKLIEKLKEEHPECSTIYLHVLPSNIQAIKFYEKHNFEFVTILPEYYEIDLKFRDAYLYRLELKPKDTQTSKEKPKSETIEGEQTTPEPVQESESNWLESKMSEMLEYFSRPFFS